MEGTTEAATGGGLTDAIANIMDVIDAAIPLLLAVAVIIFLWGLVQFMFKIGGDEGTQRGKQIMIWGIVVLFVMVSVWGLVGLLQSTLGLESSTAGDVFDQSDFDLTPGE